MFESPVLFRLRRLDIEGAWYDDDCDRRNFENH